MALRAQKKVAFRFREPGLLENFCCPVVVCDLRRYECYANRCALCSILNEFAVRCHFNVFMSFVIYFCVGTLNRSFFKAPPWYCIFTELQQMNESNETVNVNLDTNYMGNKVGSGHSYSISLYI